MPETLEAFKTLGAGKPILVVVLGATEDDIKGNDYLMNVVFSDERLRIATKFFTLVKLIATAKEFTISELNGQRPSVILIGARNYKFEGRPSAGRITGAMRDLVRLHYKQDLSHFTSDFIKYLNDLERLARTQARLNQDLAKAPRISRGLELRQAELKKQQQTLQQHYEELLKKAVVKVEEVAPEVDK